MARSWLVVGFVVFVWFGNFCDAEEDAALLTSVSHQSAEGMQSDSSKPLHGLVDQPTFVKPTSHYALFEQPGAHVPVARPSFQMPAATQVPVARPAYEQPGAHFPVGRPSFQMPAATQVPVHRPAL